MRTKYNESFMKCFEKVILFTIGTYYDNYVYRDEILFIFYGLLRNIKYIALSSFYYIPFSSMYISKSIYSVKCPIAAYLLIFV